MEKIYFATSNPDKITIAQTICEPLGITVEPVSLDIDEIQGEDPKAIIKHKVVSAYEAIHKPVVVSDDTWNIPALNGFPGPYMKSVNHWFSPEDFLRLMYGIEDRRIILHQYLAYTDGQILEVFSNEIRGKIIHEARGISVNSPNKSVTVLESDKGKTIAEVFETGSDAVAERYKNRQDAWHGFAQWLLTKNT